MNKKYLPCMLAGIPVLGFPVTNDGIDDSRPNIVIILADDLGTCELSCYGGQNIETNNIDRIAREGVRLTNNYASATMSVPIRASLYTGLYPAHHGSYQNHKNSYDNIKSITHYLPEAGYRVARTGKQHTTPRSVYNFEELPGFMDNCVARNVTHTMEGVNEFIRRSEDPFCLFVCSVHPHMPWTSGDPNEFDSEKIILPPNCVDNQQTRELFCSYLAEIRELDNEVGDIINSLEDAGKLENTLLIFLGEQGPQMPYGKWTSYRYGQNSAFIARYPSRIKANTVNDALVQYEDILPTLMEFAGGSEIEGIDGISCLPVLYGNSEGERKWSYGIHNNIPEGPAYPIRSIQDKRYKLIINLMPEAEYYEKHMMNVNNPTRQVWSSWLESAGKDEKAEFLVSRFVKRPAVEFYDLKEDPWELNNLAEKEEYSRTIAMMKGELEKWMEQQGDTGISMDIKF